MLVENDKEDIITDICWALSYLSDGAIIGFDEINVKSWPGETKALREWIGDRNMQIKHSNHRAAAGYVRFKR